MVNYFGIPESSKSFNHLTAFSILLDDMVSNDSSQYFNTEHELAAAGRDERTCLASPNVWRHELRKGISILPFN